MLVAPDVAILYVLADTGLRASEFCGLNVKDIDFEKGTLTVRRGKGGKDRVLSIGDADPHEIVGGLTLRALTHLPLSSRGPRLVEHRALWLSGRGRRLNANSLRVQLARFVRRGWNRRYETAARLQTRVVYGGVPVRTDGPAHPDRPNGLVRQGQQRDGPDVHARRRYRPGQDLTAAVTGASVERTASASTGHTTTSTSAGTDRQRRRTGRAGRPIDGRSRLPGRVARRRQG